MIAPAGGEGVMTMTAFTPRGIPRSSAIGSARKAPTQQEPRPSAAAATTTAAPLTVSPRCGIEPDPPWPVNSNAELAGPLKCEDSAAHCLWEVDEHKLGCLVKIVLATFINDA